MTAVFTAAADLQQRLGHAELATTQIYATAVSARRRATVMALKFGGAESPAHSPAAATQ